MAKLSLLVLVEEDQVLTIDLIGTHTGLMEKLDILLLKNVFYCMVFQRDSNSAVMKGSAITK